MNEKFAKKVSVNSVVYEALWAPKDPRDKLYDESSGKAVKLVAVVRIAGSYHPVLNLFILIIDGIRRLGMLTAVLLWVVVLSILAGLWAL